MIAEVTGGLDQPLDAPANNPLDVIRGLAMLRRLIGLYPEGHPVVAEKLAEVDRDVQRQLRASPHGDLSIDVVRGDVHVDGVALRSEGLIQREFARELVEIGVHSVVIRAGVTADELGAVAGFLWEFSGETGGEPVDARLVRREVTHVSLGKIIPLDTRWHTRKWADAPTGRLDPAYEESLLLAQETFENVAAGNELDRVTLRDLVQLLIRRVGRSNAALGQVLAVKQYENLTYIHSVNVAMLSLLIGRELGLGEATMTELVEGALLHDIGKTRVPLELVRKPGKLDQHERKQIEAHAAYGGEILAGTPGLRPLTPTLALEHHRTVKGGGYPDLGEGVIPHPMSQIVSVADVYEAITGARSYKDPTAPERACLVLARIAGDQLNSALVKAFINKITFYPIGSLVRTDRGETGVVVRTVPADPLHPVVAMLNEEMDCVIAEVDTSARDSGGGYERHVAETLRAPEHLDLTRFLSLAPAPTEL